MAGLLSMVAVSMLFLKVRSTFLRLSVSLTLFVGLGVAYYLGWEKLEPRLIDSMQGFKGRLSIAEIALKMIDEYPIVGSGPGSFEAVAQFEMGETFTEWASWVHNDYLEFYLTFGIPGGSILIALAFILTLQYSRIILGDPVRSIKWFGLLAVIGVAIRATLDFPLQVYSILVPLMIISTVLLTNKSQSQTIPSNQDTRRSAPAIETK